ncbi:Mbeg1-like protein, partial [Streptococcus pyogenes]
SHVSPEYQERIQEIYSFDGPGLHSSILSSKGYKDIERKVQAIIPENSIVGMMLEPPEADLIVKSKSIGLLQHNTFSWEIEEDHFKVVSKVKDDSIQ